MADKIQPKPQNVPAEWSWLFYVTQEQTELLRQIKNGIVFFIVLAVIALLFAGCNAFFGGV